MPRRNQSPKHTPFAFKSTCKDKRRFPTQLRAQAAADELALLRPSEELRVYACELCGGWHLTRGPVTKK